MDQSKVDFIIATCRNKFSPLQLQQIITMLKNVDDSKYALVQSIDFKDPDTALILSILAGGWGVDRFYLNDIPMGLLKLFTGGCCGILWIIDIINIKEKTRNYNFQQVMMVLNGMVF